MSGDLDDIPTLDPLFAAGEVVRRYHAYRIGDPGPTTEKAYFDYVEQVVGEIEPAEWIMSFLTLFEVALLDTDEDQNRWARFLATLLFAEAEAGFRENPWII